MKQSLSSLPDNFEYHLDLSKHVTPRLLKDQAVHRWFYFPHSFSPDLVDLLFDHWGIKPGDVVVDPFVGAGTTLLAAKSRDVSAIGTDLSPLALLVSNTKVRDLEATVMRMATANVRHAIEAGDCVVIDRSQRLRRAFTDKEFMVFTRLQQAIADQTAHTRDFLMLALLRTQQHFSRAVPDGGWFRWRDLPSSENDIVPRFLKIAESMIGDLDSKQTHHGTWQAHRQDARSLDSIKIDHPILTNGCQAVITSPPYPNRHDYSRIFQIELLTLGQSESDIFSLRYESLRSNVEARAPQIKLPQFQLPTILKETLTQLPEIADSRISPMLAGYFEDMNAVLKAAYRILAPGGHIALVVGNVRHAGVMVPVDAILAEIAEHLGYQREISWVARLRGNSAQQMGRYGREPSRETIVIMRKPD